ncbi:hypothetical protein K0U07_00265 [bacterium]|nr:hypothetical protein [bacterium]
MKEALMKHFFAPVPARFRLLLVFPMLNLLVLAIALLFLKAPKEAILLAMSGISFTVFLVGSRKFVSLFYYSSLLFNLAIFFVTWGAESFWMKGWSLSMMVSLTIGYYLSLEVLDFFHGRERNLKESTAEKGLWKNRFETLRDSHSVEMVGLEEELNKTLKGFKEKDEQIEALEKLVEVTHKEASILSRQKQELMDKVRASGDLRGNEEIKHQNVGLQKEIERLSVVERDLGLLKQEKENTAEEVSLMQEEARVAQAKLLDEIEELKRELEKTQIDGAKMKEVKGYSAGEVVKLLQSLPMLKTNPEQLDVLLTEIKARLGVVNKPFKWQVWKGEKKEKKEAVAKGKISMTDLGKGLKI